MATELPDVVILAAAGRGIMAEQQLPANFILRKTWMIDAM